MNSCGERGSNTRPSDLQSDALPTELSPLGNFYNNLFILSLKNPNRASDRNVWCTVINKTTKSYQKQH